MTRRSRWIPVVFVVAWVAQAAFGTSPPEALAPASDGPCDQAAEGIARVLQVCDSGGEGARACETRWTVSVGGWGWPSGCGISCNTGYYACCTNPTWHQNATCGCIEDPPHVAPVPWSPEQPGL